MRDVRSMAHVEKFSFLTVPMLWFEIVSFDWLIPFLLDVISYLFTGYERITTISDEPFHPVP
jgi:predicted membrane chloride channel (bestrophin family)